MKYQVRKSIKHEEQYHLYRKILWWWEYVDCFYKKGGESLAQATDRVIGYKKNNKGPIVLEVER